MEPELPGNHFAPVDARTVATRLAVLFWAGIPDAELEAVAADGSLLNEDVLIAQVDRMLADRKVVGMAEEFVCGWLDLRDFPAHRGVDRSLYPQFDDALHKAMYHEPIYFTADLFMRDRSLFEFLESKTTIVNQRLREHYRMGGSVESVAVGEGRWFRMNQPNGRRGLLGMSAFLTINAAGQRTSPVQRGHWVVRRLLGEHIPPPPNTVPELPSSEKELGKLTLREALAVHREQESCARCHQRFDGIGLVFENFGPLGEHRTKDLGGRPVETTGDFPRGVGKNDGIDGLLEYVNEHRRQDLIRHFIREFVSYALGRELLVSDDELLQRVEKQLVANEYRLSALVRTVVTSTQFRSRRGTEFPE
jgi:hypothetical protein